MIEPVAIVTDWTASADVAEFASRQGVSHVGLPSAPKPELNAALATVLREAAPDLVVLTFDRIVPPDLVSAFSGRMINVHPSLLPAFPGRDAIERTVASGVRYGGATVHEVAVEVDTGPVVAQVVVPRGPQDDTQSYGRRLYAHLEPMYLDVLHWYAEGRVRHTPGGEVVIDGGRYDLTPQSPVVP